MLSDEEVEVIREWSQTVEVGQELTLAGINERLRRGRATTLGKALRAAVERGDGRVDFLRLVGYDDEGQPRTSKTHHIRYLRVR